MRYKLNGIDRCVSLVLLLLLGNILLAQQSIPGLWQPVQLEKDTTKIFLSDFYAYPEKIDSFKLPNGLKQIDKSKDYILTVVASNDIPALAEMNLWIGGSNYSVLLKKSKRKSYHFTFDPKGKDYKTVQLAGDLNDWNPAKSAFAFTNGKWGIDVTLNPGTYQYQIVADSKWMLDPANADSASNNNGGFNSVFKAGAINNKDLPRLSASGFVNETGVVKIHVSKEYSQRNTAVIALIDNQDLRIEKGKGDGDYLFYVPQNFTKIKRTFIRVYAYNEMGEGNSLLIPLQNGKVVNDASKITRADKEANAVYFVLVDRFADGDLTNDKKVVHPDIKPKANYYGGDLKGILEKSKEGYFNALHINTIWISPIVQNPETAFKEFPEPHDWYSGYHGYWPISLTNIDYRYGNDKVMTDMVNSLHKNNINLWIDLVANHVHEDYPPIKKHPEWKTQLDLPDGKKNIRLWDEHRLTTWFDTFLPTLEFTNKEVLKMEVDSSIYWVQKFGIDGFRHDATKHIPTEFWRALTLDLKKKIEYPKHISLYQLGETYGSKELISSYIGAGMMDGQFDFNLYFDAQSAFSKEGVGFEVLARTLQQSLDMYGSHHLMGNISGNHDMPRFISLAGGALSFSEDARKAGWSREVGVGSDTAYLKLACLHAFNATIPGVPVIYYGDEIGMPGAGDPDNRRMMKFEGLTTEEQKLKDTVTKLMEARSKHMSLLYGDFTLLQADKNTMAYKREYFDDIAIVVFNGAATEQNYTFDATEYPSYIVRSNYKGLISLSAYAISEKTRDIKVKLPAKSFEIFFLEKK